MKKVNQIGERAAFTIVELLTVMAVIAILIGLLVPALGLVHDTAKDLQQKAQFHAIEVGLEAYKEAMGSYPDSEDSQYRTDSNNNSLGLDHYCGANKLAEALVGYDLMGFHPKSEYTASGLDLASVAVYNTTQANLDQREDLFLEIEKANAYKLADIYGTRTGTFNTNYYNYVLGDSYSKRRAQSGLKIGSPILYFKANTKFKLQDPTNDADGDGNTRNDDVYNYLDNEAIVALGSADNGEPHYLTATTFDNIDPADPGIIINNQVQAPVPYNAKSFILMSAGKDGLFGNADDIYNFEKKE